MIINDKNGLLKAKEITSDLLEELSQTAAGPELEDAAELKNEATEETAAKELSSDIDNEDVYGDDEESAEDVEGVVVKEEADNEATVEKEPEELSSDIDNEDVYGDDEERAEDVEGVVVKEDLSYIANLLETYGEDILEGFEIEEIEELTNLLEAPFQVGGGKKQQEIQDTATKNAETARKRAVSAATTFSNKAKESWNAKKGISNAWGRFTSKISGNKEKLEQLQKEREAGKKKRDQYNNRASGAIKGYNTSINRIEGKRLKAQEDQNKKSLSSNMSQLVKKGTVEKGTDAYEQKKAELGQKQTTGTAISANPIKQRGLFKKVIKESFSDIELLQLLEANGYVADIENLILFKEGLESGLYTIDEEALEGESPEVNKAEETFEDTTEAPAKVEDKEDSDEESKLEDDKDEEDEDKKEDDEKKEDEKDDEDKKENIDESLDGLISLINQINESLSQTAAGPELESAAELKNEATEEKEEAELKSDIDNKEVYCDDCHEQKEDVGEVVVKEEADNEATVEKEPEELSSEIDNEDVYGDDEERAEEVEGVVVKEEADNEATEDKEPKTAEVDVDNKDVYCDDCHKQVEDVVEVVVEAVSICKAKGVPATIENIVTEAKTLFEAESVKIGDFDKKEFDIDAAIESSEWNGNDGKFEDYKDIQGKGAESALTGLRESVKYGSLKEACMLDEGYFENDSYVKETADEKVAKLTEQVSLLMAREVNDPLYTELLRESAYCMRLREEIQNKYNSAASEKVEVIRNN